MGKKASEGHKILFISYYFPPVGTVGTFRNYYIAKGLSKYFEASFLITIRNKVFQMDEDMDTSYTEIYNVNNFDYRSLTRRSALKEDKIYDKIKSIGPKNRQLISRILDTYPLNIFWGEGGSIYIRAALKKAKKLIKTQGITHIYSSFRPFSDHYIAYRLKKSYPHLKWIADFRDLPVDRNRKNVFFPDSITRIYRKIFKKADLLTSVSKGLTTELEHYNSNVLLVRNGINSFNHPGDIKDNHKFTISYTGSLYPGYQSPELLLIAVRKLLEKGIVQEKQFQIVYAGKDAGIWKKLIQEFELEAVSDIKGLLSYSDSRIIQYSSHMNLLLTWSGPHSGGTITGKFSEYLSAGKAIICLLKGDRDYELESIYEKTNAGIVFYESEVQELSDYILKYYQEWQNSGSCEHNYNLQEIDKFTWNYQVNKLKQRVLT